MWCLLQPGLSTMGTVVSAECSKVGEAVAAGLRSRTRYTSHHPEPRGRGGRPQTREMRKDTQVKLMSLCVSEGGLWRKHLERGWGALGSYRGRWCVVRNLIRRSQSEHLRSRPQKILQQESSGSLFGFIFLQWATFPEIYVCGKVAVF